MYDKELTKDQLELSKIQDEIQEDYLEKDNVLGVGIGKKFKNGRETDDTCLSVFVTQKLDKDLLNEDSLIPEYADNKKFKTDVIETGEVFAGMDIEVLEPAKKKENGHASMTRKWKEWQEELTLTEEFGGVDVQALRGRSRPCEGGYSLGHYKVTAGTYGTAVYRKTEFPGVPTKFYILSNNHVLANTNDARIGDPIIQPGRYDGGTVPQDIIGRLSAYKRIDFLPPYGRGISNYVDAAIAEGNFHDLNRRIYWIGNVVGTRSIKIGEIVQKTGRTTNYSTGKTIAVNATINVNYGNGKVAKFVRQIVTTAMSAGGDSGSLLCDMDNNVVGLLFAGSNRVSVHNDIRYVERIMGIKIA
ncbi:serine protease [Fulvivirga sp. RKSG066]|uniref:trypsin-like peptidase domain-containing protein n=1 Tax=Fulvivirga aurantia TaxID=2529383 RepID=UPI0012BBB534|nr:trypsin-like peptidase domain-containing protein [Fulvivirga aurantia]MTI19986.1 serine protease [Fulvivirga aurantia]